MEHWAPMMVGLGFFTLIGWIVFVIVDGSRRKERLKVFTEFHAKLIERMQSAQDFGDFLQSDGGRRFIDSLSMERSHPADRILRAVQTGVVLTFLGVGMVAAGEVGLPDDWDIGAFRVMGIIFGSIGIGFLVSSATSYFLGRSLGVLSPTDMRVE